MFVPIEHKDFTKYKQYKLKDLNNNSFKTCWLNGDLKVGTKITLKNEEDWYQVIEKYDIEVVKDVLDMNRNPKWYSVQENNILY